MKTNTILLLLCISGAVFAKEGKPSYAQQPTPSANMERLQHVTFVGDITPDFWQQMRLPYPDRHMLDTRFKQQGYYHYQTMVQVVLVTLSATVNGKRISARGTSEVLTAGQKELLRSVEQGAELEVAVAFRYKIALQDQQPGKIVRGVLTVTAVPAHEAEFPGKETLHQYLDDQIQAIVERTGAEQQVRQAMLSFTVNEAGEIEDATIQRTSTDKRVDELLLGVLQTMPRWKPATNTKGVNVKQRFTIALGPSGC